MSPVNILALIIVVLLILLIALPKLTQKTPSKIQSGFTEIKNPDIAVIEQLQKCGSDFTKKHNVDFFFYFPSKENAALAASELIDKDFETSISETEGYGQWLCLATKQLIPDANILSDLRHQFEELAMRLDGEYDGWETEVIK